MEEGENVHLTISMLQHGAGERNLTII